VVSSRLKYLYLAYLSKPKTDRAIYRTIRRQNVRKILEIGIGSVSRALRMIDLSQRFAAGEAVRYVAIDLFEARESCAGGLSLKEAHRVFKATGAPVQLIPGAAAAAVARSANSLQNMDLVIISAVHDDAALEGAWFYLPRMLQTKSLVYRETRVDATTVPTLLSLGQIEALAAASRRHRAA
jgi:hypothetical protein